MEFEIQPTLIEKVRAELHDICAIVDKSDGLSPFEMDAAAARLRDVAKQLAIISKAHQERASFVRASNDFAARYSHKLQIARDILSGQSVKQVAEKHRLSVPTIAVHLTAVTNYLRWTCRTGSTLELTFLEGSSRSKWTHFSPAEREALLAALQLFERDIVLRREGIAEAQILKQVWGIAETSQSSDD